MTVTVPPPAPNPSNPLTFNADAAAFVAYLPTLVADLNVYSGMTNSGQFTDGGAGSPSITFAAGTGTGLSRTGSNALVFSTAGTEAMRLTSSNYLYLNCTNPVAGVSAPRVNIQGQSAGGSAFAIMRESADTGGPNFILAKSRGTAADDYAIVSAGDSLGLISFQGADGDGTTQTGARISSQVIGTPAAGDVRGSLNFQTGTGASGALTTQLLIAAIQIKANLPVVVAAGSLGYGTATGQGGTVTQATSRTTGVTLNKVCGEVTLFTAAGSPTVQSFVVTNSQVAATDLIIVNVKSGTNVYRAWVSAKAAGQFTVSFLAESGTASDAPVISFAIVKAARD